MTKFFAGSWTVTFGLGVVISCAACGKKEDKKDKNEKGTFPDLSALALEIVPILSSTGSASLAYENALVTGVSDALNEVFGANDGGVNTKISIQIAQAKTALDDINASYVDEEGNPANCTETITTDSDFVVPFFGTSATPDFWGTDIPDTGKYTCFVASSSTTGNLAMAFGKDAVADADEECTDAFRYYLISGYDTGVAASRGHQIQKIVYEGCTSEIGISMGIASTRDETVTDNTSQGFHARFEMTGNVETRMFESRTYKTDLYQGTTAISGSRIEAVGSAAASGYIRANVTNCTESADGTTQVCDPVTPAEYCLQNGATEGSYDVAATTTTCDTYAADLPTALPVGAIGQTPIEMNAAAFGL